MHDGDLIRHRVAVLGSPISHSRSPDIHRAGYRALGLVDWDYSRIEVTAETFVDVIAALDDSYVGFSVTMPAKEAALNFADEVTERAALVGSANTLVRTKTGWRADCTDIDGVYGACIQLNGGSSYGENSQRSAVLIGAGGTARPALAALKKLEITAVTIIARSQERSTAAIDLAKELGLVVDFVDFINREVIKEKVTASSLVISTVPSVGIAPIVESLSGATQLLDVIYHPWPTELATAVAANGGVVVGGLVMLLHQAVSQFEQFTGQQAPIAAMAAALS